MIYCARSKRVGGGAVCVISEGATHSMLEVNTILGVAGVQNGETRRYKSLGDD